MNVVFLSPGFPPPICRLDSVASIASIPTASKLEAEARLRGNFQVPRPRRHNLGRSQQMLVETRRVISHPTACACQPARLPGNAACNTAGMHIAFKRCIRGALAGLAATAPMSSVMLLGKAMGALGEPPPRRLTRKLLKPLGPLAPKGRELDAAALGAHLAFGAAMGVIWELLPARLHTAQGGAAFGLAVWSANYAGWLPATGLMPPPSRDRIARPTTMVLAHLVFGAALYAGTRVLAPRVISS